MTIKQYTDFSGGLNDRIGPIVNDNASATEALYWAEDGDNIDFASDGLVKFTGYTQQLNSAIGASNKILGLFTFNNKIIVCVDNGNIYEVAAGVATSLYASFTAGEYYCQGFEYNGLLIICNGQNTPVAYNGTTVSVLAPTDPDTLWNSAKPKGGAVFRGRVFYWGDSTNAHRLYVPVAGTHQNFTSATGATTIDVELGNGGVITQIAPIANDALIIYKERIIRRLGGLNKVGTGSDEFNIKVVTNETGCPAGRTVVTMGMEQYFLASGGIRTLSTVQEYGDFAVTQPSFLAKDEFLDIDFAGNATAVSKAVGVYYKTKNQMYFSFPTGSSTTNTQTLVLDFLSKPGRGGEGVTVSPRSGFSVSSYGYLADSLYHGDYAGQFYKHSDTSDYNGSAISSTWESKWVAHGGIEQLKRYKRLTLAGTVTNDTNLALEVSLLDSDGTRISVINETLTGGTKWNTANWNTFNWGGQSLKVIDYFNFGRGRAIKLRLLNNSTGQNHKIHQISIEYDELGVKRA